MTDNSDEYGTQAAAAIAARLADMRAAAAALEAARINGETYADADSVRDAVSRMAEVVTLDIIEMYEWAALWFSHSGPGPYVFPSRRTGKKGAPIAIIPIFTGKSRNGSPGAVTAWRSGSENGLTKGMV